MVSCQESILSATRGSVSLLFLPSMPTDHTVRGLERLICKALTGDPCEPPSDFKRFVSDSSFQVAYRGEADSVREG